MASRSGGADDTVKPTRRCFFFVFSSFWNDNFIFFKWHFLIIFPLTCTTFRLSFCLCCWRWNAGSGALASEADTPSACCISCGTWRASRCCCRWDAAGASRRSARFCCSGRRASSPATWWTARRSAAPCPRVPSLHRRSVHPAGRCCWRSSTNSSGGKRSRRRANLCHRRGRPAACGRRRTRGLTRGSLCSLVSNFGGTKAGKSPPTPVPTGPTSAGFHPPTHPSPGRTPRRSPGSAFHRSRPLKKFHRQQAPAGSEHPATHHRVKLSVNHIHW